MTIYLSLLRGINVSGQKKIKMDDLKALYEDLGFSNVRTYIQSGNVVFESLLDRDTLAGKIQTAIMAQYGFEVHIVIRTTTEMQEVLACQPFTEAETAQLYVSFLDNLPTLERVETLKAFNFAPDILQIVGKTVYLRVDSYGKTKLSNAFIESKLQVKATTRNWNTLNNLVAMLGD